MIKKIYLLTLILLIIFVSSTISYTESNISTDFKSTIEITEREKGVEIMSPEDKFSTSEDTILFSGRAKEGTNIIVEVYLVIDPIENYLDFDIVAENITADEICKIYALKNLKVKELGLFSEEIELKAGYNKVVMYAIKDDEVIGKAVRYITVIDEEKAKEYIDKLNKDNLLDSINSIIIKNKE